MKLIVALGNPTPKYAKTRHNAGFMALDFFISQLKDLAIDSPNRPRDSTLFLHLKSPNLAIDFSISAKFNAEILKCENVIFAKPQSFMNASGEAIKKIADFYKINIADIAVLHDDLDLNLGAVRFKIGGGDAGHNGLKSIDALVGREYLRIRIGIGKPQKYSQNAVLDFVLGDFEPYEIKTLRPVFENVANALFALIDGANLNDLQNKFTKKISANGA
ncbi:aminoacyl-tRNA hydrolase [Helicobacter sp. 23-1044]